MRNNTTLLLSPRHCCRMLVTLKETNQAAFNALLQQDLEGLLPLVYTPTIGDACLAWGSLLPRPTGLYITSNDRCVTVQ
jgi:malate dehydrogenase (oxaloacetate-decarboxylating)(NADP+)